VSHAFITSDLTVRANRSAPWALVGVPRTRLVESVWLLLCVVPLVAVAQVAGLGSIDPWWNFALGRLMLEQRQLIVADNFSYTPTVPGAINQQWLAQLIWATAYQLGDQVAVFVLRGLAVATTAICLWLIARHLGASRRAILASSLVALPLICSNLGIRAQTLAFPIAGLSLLLLQRGGRLKWLVVPLCVVWSNVHGSFPLAVAFTGAFAVGRFLSGARRDALLFALLTVFTALATLVTPFGLDVWRYTFEMSSNPALRKALVEWGPTTLDTLTGKAFYVAIAGTCLVLALRRPRVPLPWLLLAAGLSLFALSAVRNVVWFGIAAIPLWAALVDRSFGFFADHPTRPRVALLMGAALVAIAFLPTYSEQVHLPSQPVADVAPADQDRALSDLTDYLLAHPQGRLFHDADWGAYLEAHAWPQQQVFVDTRYEVHPNNVWDDYYAVIEGRDDWATILDRYGVDRIALDPAHAAKLTEAIDTSGEWAQVWRTERGSANIVVWERRAVAAQAGSF
jgi:hypothetical protein